MATRVAGSIVADAVAVFTAMTGVGLESGVLGIDVSVAVEVGRDVGVHRAASAVDVIC
jgi:hypothetical protein